jgi:hypothetical protein
MTAWVIFSPSAPLAASVDPRGLAQLLRDGPEELPHQEDVEGAPEPGRQPERQQRADEPERLEDPVERHHQRGERNHHGGERQREERVTPAPFQAREPVGDNRVRDHRPEDAEDGDRQRVAKEGPEPHPVAVGRGVPAEGRQRARVVVPPRPYPRIDPVARQHVPERRRALLAERAVQALRDVPGAGGHGVDDRRRDRARGELPRPQETQLPRVLAREEPNDGPRLRHLEVEGDLHALAA